jgi:signal transduction histidine kinase
LVLDWYGKDHIWNVNFDASFQAALNSSAPGSVEIYTEYLETNRFPGENQALLLRDYLVRKYADRTIDVVVANSDASLDFLLKYRHDLFPQAPIVFVAIRHPTNEELASGPGLTGVINLNTYRQTLELALRLHPQTQHVFVVSGTLEHDKRFEAVAREQLRDYESKVQINYLTDLAAEELPAKIASLPERSLVLYAWQQSQNEQGKVLETEEMFDLVARSTSVPIYGMTLRVLWTRQTETSNDRSGMIGGYTTSGALIAPKAAEMVLRITKGARPQDIPVVNSPIVPMFDWRELQRWGISESQLPADSVVLFKQSSFWEQYRWRILGVLVLVLIETMLIVGLLIQRSQRARSEESRRLSESALRKMTGQLITLRDEEQRRIAAELHDGLGQSLVIINNRALIGLRDADPSSRVMEQFEEISSAASSAIDEVRDIVYNLRPHELGKLGLVQAIKSMVSKISDLSTLRVSTDLDEVDGLLSEEAETSIYRIVQEALNNVVKHAEATEAKVTLKRTGRELLITVTDNGRGIVKPSNGEKNGFGLVGIQLLVKAPH